MDNRIDPTQNQDQELVEFEAEMPQLDNEDVEFVADEQLEEEIQEEI